MAAILAPIIVPGVLCFCSRPALVAAALHLSVSLLSEPRSFNDAGVAGWPSETACAETGLFANTGRRPPSCCSFRAPVRRGTPAGAPRDPQPLSSSERLLIFSSRSTTAYLHGDLSRFGTVYSFIFIYLNFRSKKFCSTRGPRPTCEGRELRAPSFGGGAGYGFQCFVVSKRPFDPRGSFRSKRPRRPGSWRALFGRSLRRLPAGS